MASSEFAQSWLSGSGLACVHAAPAPANLFAVGLAALAEAAADTVSSEAGQVLSQALGGRPRMITTLRPAEPGTDGAVSLLGTLQCRCIRQAV
jgi:uncharacterized membrane protein